MREKGRMSIDEFYDDPDWEFEKMLAVVVAVLVVVFSLIKYL